MCWESALHGPSRQAEHVQVPAPPICLPATPVPESDESVAHRCRIHYRQTKRVQSNLNDADAVIPCPLLVRNDSRALKRCLFPPPPPLPIHTSSQDGRAVVLAARYGHCAVLHRLCRDLEAMTQVVEAQRAKCEGG